MKYNKIDFTASAVAAMSFEQFAAKFAGQIGCNPNCEAEELRMIYDKCCEEAKTETPAPEQPSKPRRSRSTKDAPATEVAPEQPAETPVEENKEQ